MTMRDRLNALNIQQQRQLQVAFEQGFAQFVELGDGHFVGVNVAPIKHLAITESAGSWAYGIIKGKDK